MKYAVITPTEITYWATRSSAASYVKKLKKAGKTITSVIDTKLNRTINL